MKNHLAKILGTGMAIGILLLAFEPTSSRPGRKYFDYGVLSFGGKLHPVFRDEKQRAHLGIYSSFVRLIYDPWTKSCYNRASPIRMRS